MQVNTIRAALLVGAAVVAAPMVSSNAQAALIVEGISYTLTDANLGSNLSTHNYTLNISGINQAGVDTKGGRASVNALAFNRPSSYQSATMTSPTGYSTVNTGLSASGCSGGGNFFCFDFGGAGVTSPSSPALTASTLTFLFSVTTSNTSALNNWSPDFKIDWQGTANNYDLVSKTLSPEAQPVPEPMSIALFGAGLVGLGLASRRRKAKMAKVDQALAIA